MNTTRQNFPFMMYLFISGMLCLMILLVSSKFLISYFLTKKKLNLAYVSRVNKKRKVLLHYIHKKISQRTRPISNDINLSTSSPTKTTYSIPTEFSQPITPSQSVEEYNFEHKADKEGMTEKLILTPENDISHDNPKEDIDIINKELDLINEKARLEKIKIAFIQNLLDHIDRYMQLVNEPLSHIYILICLFIIRIAALFILKASIFMSFDIAKKLFGSKSRLAFKTIEELITSLVFMLNTVFVYNLLITGKSEFPNFIVFVKSIFYTLCVLELFMPAVLYLVFPVNNDWKPSIYHTNTVEFLYAFYMFMLIVFLIHAIKQGTNKTFTIFLGSLIPHWISRRCRKSYRIYREGSSNVQADKMIRETMKKSNIEYYKELKIRKQSKKHFEFFLALIFWIYVLTLFTYAYSAVDRYIKIYNDKNNNINRYHKDILDMRFKSRSMLLYIPKIVSLLWYLKMFKKDLEKRQRDRIILFKRMKQLMSIKVTAKHENDDNK